MAPGLRRLSLVVAVFVLALPACRQDAGRANEVRTELGDAAALVNGEPISLEEVRRVCEATGVDAKAALRQLVDERLLVQHAAARGYASTRAFRVGLEQALVRAVLAQEIEGPGSPTDVAQRRDKLERWLSELRQQTTVRYDEAAIQKAFVLAAP